MKKLRLSADSYIEVAVAGAANRRAEREARSFLVRQGIPSAELVFSEDKRGFKVAAFTKSFEKAGVLAAKSKTLGRSLRFSARVLGRGDWLDKWQADYRMQPIGKKLLLVPSWQKKDYSKKEKRYPVFLDPKSVFGSGTHPTTCMMMELLEKIEGRFETFLDLGTGTGVLSVAAGRLGAKKILAIDHDRMAVQTANANLKLNGLSGKAVRKELRKTSLFKPFDAVAANLFTKLLLEIKQTVFQSVKPGGHLLISGTYSKNLDELLRGFRHPDFLIVRKMKRQGWTALLLKRASVAKS